jgi:hypothetical protein
MNSYKPRITNERSKIIQIQKPNPTNMKESFNAHEYSLKQNFFDPSKRSPPNEFMLKLKLRISLLSE